jgi:hypothetical protein
VQHVVASFFDGRCAGEVDQQLEGGPVDPVQAVIDMEIPGIEDQGETTFWVGVEPSAKVKVAPICPTRRYG